YKICPFSSTHSVRNMAHGYAPTAMEDDGCGGVGGLCFESDGVRYGHWRHYGHGQGAYEKVEDLKYVGQGRGSWDREVLPTGWRCRFSSLACCFLVLVAAALAVGYAISGRAFHSAVGNLAGLRFDCTAAIDSWETVWTDEKKAYCCARVGHGCAAQPYDCQAARGNWQAAWSEAKKKWCCEFEGSCPGGSTMQFDCSGTEADWSSDKKNWCCKEHNRGCDVAEPYDCRAGVTNWQNGWSDHKKYWCCNKYDVACPNPVVFDCDAGYSNWQRTWSADKKAWCCGRLHRGCDTPQPFDCDDGFHEWRSHWSLEKQHWCCVHASRACREEHHHVQVVQVPVKVPVPVPVVVHHHHHHIVHNREKIVGEHWITHHYTHDTETHEAYQCWKDAGWRTWSHDHRHYCCSHHHVACGDPYAHHHEHAAVVTHVTHVVYGHHSHDNYDCSAGVRNWKAGWSDTKKQFCCQKYSLGCEDFSGGDTVIDGGVSSEGSTIVDGGSLLSSVGTVDDSAGVESVDTGAVDDSTGVES
ncbi:unnamed protein product, partial [Durusdinium trenchii]